MNEQTRSAEPQAPTRVVNPFGPTAVVAAEGASAAALGKREVADAQSARMIARAYPRDERRAMDRITTAFQRGSLAEDAEYQYGRGGEDVTGLTIRAAEEICRHWGNIESGIAELSRGNGQSECLAFCEDLETGYRDSKRFFVRHWRDRKSGRGYAVTEERDIYEVVANMGARRKRACMLAVIPIDVQEAVQRQVALTLKVKAEVTPDGIKAMLEKFSEFSVTKEHIEKRLQRNIESMQPAQLLGLRRIYNSLKDGMSVAVDWFEIAPPESTEGPAGTADRAKEALRAAAQTKAEEKPPAEKAGEEKPADKASDLGGYVPHFDSKSAIAELKKAKTVKALEDTMKLIEADYRASRRSLPAEIEPAFADRKAAIETQM